MIVQPAWVSADTIASDDITHAFDGCSRDLSHCPFLSWVAMKNPSATGADVDAAVPARITGHVVDVPELVLRIIDALPGRARVVGAVHAPRTADGTGEVHRRVVLCPGAAIPNPTAAALFTCGTETQVAPESCE